MIIHDLDAFHVTFRPDEADTPLIVDTNTMLASATANQGLQSVPGRSREVTKQCRLMKLAQLTLSAALHVVGQSPGKPSAKQRLGIAVRKRQYHLHSDERNAF
jgi:hypothetical protein